MKKRILILNWWDIKNPKAGGAEVHLDEVFSRLNKKRFDVTLLCSKFQNSKPCEKINGIKVFRKGSIYTINIISFFWYLVHKNEFDMVIDYTNKIPYLTCFYTRKKTIAIAHHVFGEIWDYESPIFGSLFKKIERFLYRLYKNTKIIAVSESTKNELIDIGIKKQNITIIRNGVNNYQYKGTKNKTPLGIYVGRIKKYKRIHLIINAIENIKDNIKNLKVIIVGRGGDLSRLKKIVNKKNLNKYIKFTGFVDEKTKIQLLGQAWFNVQPSIKEGWGFTVMEAAVCGTPSVATNVPGLRESVLSGKTGWLFEKNDIDGLKNLLVELFTNQKKREKAAKEALKFAKNFSWDKTTKELEKEILKMI